MSTQRGLSVLRRTIAVAMAVCTAGAVSAGPPATETAPSAQMREQMAAVHERMAACLRSDKPLADCRNEMRTNCQQMMGSQDCPMMGMGPQNRMMKQPPSDTPERK